MLTEPVWFASWPVQSARAAGSLTVAASMRAASSAAGAPPVWICPSSKPSTCW